MKTFDPLVIKPTVQNYHWGKLGGRSLVARLLESFNSSLPYAELWYGSHAKSPSLALLAEGNQSVDKLLASDAAQILGSKVLNSYGPTLPFLTKILSIEKALSIQAHPSKENAKILNSRNPQNYPDTNHKPEIAIALTEVELIHGWISAEEVLLVSIQFPDIQKFLKKFDIDLSIWTAESRKKIVTTLFAASPAEIAGLNNMVLKSLVAKNELTDKQQLYLTLAKQVELSDVGLLLAMFLRHLKLSVGESMFTPAGEIHAYLSGDLFECMANSDNVIRSGLTPKFQDVSALINYANFSEGSCSISTPEKSSRYSNFLEYSSSAEEFRVLSVLKTEGDFKYSKNSEGPELIVVIEGNLCLEQGDQNLSLKQGEALLIPASVRDLSFKLKNASFIRVLVP